VALAGSGKLLLIATLIRWRSASYISDSAAHSFSATPALYLRPDLGW
jgi:hypothetical protein